MTELEEKLMHEFSDRSLLETALTHSSYANENRASGCVCNERLEFLGDSILGMNVAEYLYLNFPDMPEGRMTKLRAELVCEQNLVKIARMLDVGGNIRLGKGEESTGGRTRKSILADAVEAILAALYIDGGAEKAAAMIDKFIIRPAFDTVSRCANVKNHDYKTALQELVQRKSGRTLCYEMLGESGPDHNKEFTAQVMLNGVSVGTGTGRSKKEAEQAAAQKALENFDK